MKNIILYFLFSLSALTTFAQNWKQVGTMLGDNSGAWALYVDTVNDYLYVGGYFEKKVNNKKSSFSLVRFNNGKEEILDSMATNTIFTIYPYKGDLYVGGGFDRIGGKSLWDSTKLEFVHTGGVVTYGIARLRNDTFEVVNPIKRRVTVLSLTQHQGNLIIGGSFGAFGGIKSNGVLAYNGIRFLPLGGGVMNEFGNPKVHSVYSFENVLYAGGNFDYNWPKNPYNRSFQSYSNQKWKQVNGWQKQGAIGMVVSMIKYKNELYLAGFFHKKDGDLANSIVKYDGTYFYELGDGVQDYYVNNMIVFNNQLFAVGNFKRVDNINANSIVKWDGMKWCNLSNDVFEYNIETMAVFHDTLHILGNFHSINGKPISTLAKWVGDPKMESNCAPPAEIKKVNYNLGFSENQLTQFKFNIYPNPVSELLLIEKLKNTEDFYFNLLNTNGEKVKDGSLKLIKTEINISGLKSGIYVIEIFNNNERFSKKIIIE